MKIALFGFGKMGKAIEKIAVQQGDQIVLKVTKNSCLDQAKLSECDVCLDFSSPSCVLSHLELACSNQKPIVIGTTGWENDLPRAKELVQKKKGKALYSPNFSIGVQAFLYLLKWAQTVFPGYFIAGLETHHKEKKDAPSGTAKAIEKALKMEQPFASLRLGTAFGKHEVFFDSASDRIHMSHEAKNREAFAAGALKAAYWLKDQNGWFELDDYMRSIYGNHHPF